MTASDLSLPPPTQKMVFLRMFNELRDELDNLPEPSEGTDRQFLYKAIPFFVNGCGILACSGKRENEAIQKAEEVLALLGKKYGAQDEWMKMLQDLHNLTLAILEG